MLVFGLITSVVPWYPLFVFTWWVTGTMSIACYTAAFVWTMEMAAGPYKTYISMSMNYSWPLCRLIIAGGWSVDRGVGLLRPDLTSALSRPGVWAA